MYVCKRVNYKKIEAILPTYVHTNTSHKHYSIYVCTNGTVRIYIVYVCMQTLDIRNYYLLVCMHMYAHT